MNYLVPVIVTNYLESIAGSPASLEWWSSAFFFFDILTDLIFCFPPL